MKLVYLAPAAVLAASAVIAADQECTSKKVAIEDLTKAEARKYNKAKPNQQKKLLFKFCRDRKENNKSCCPPAEEPKLDDAAAMKFMEETNDRLDMLERTAMGEQFISDMRAMSARLDKLEEFMEKMIKMMGDKKDKGDGDNKGDGGNKGDGDNRGDGDNNNEEDEQEEEDPKEMILKSIMEMMEQGMNAEQIAPKIRQMLEMHVAKVVGEGTFAAYEKEKDDGVKAWFKNCLDNPADASCKEWYDDYGKNVMEAMIEEMIMMAVELRTKEEQSAFHDNCLMSFKAIEDNIQEGDNLAPEQIAIMINNAYEENHPDCYAEMKKIYNDQQDEIMDYAKQFFEDAQENAEDAGDMNSAEMLDQCLEVLEVFGEEDDFTEKYDGRVDWEKAYKKWYADHAACAKSFEDSWYQGFMLWAAETGMDLAQAWQEDMEDAEEADQEFSAGDNRGPRYYLGGYSVGYRPYQYRPYGGYNWRK